MSGDGDGGPIPGPGPGLLSEIGDGIGPPIPDLPGTGMDPRPRVVSGIPRPQWAGGVFNGRSEGRLGPGAGAGVRESLVCELANCQCTSSYYRLSGYKYQTKEGPSCNLVAHASSCSLMVGPSWSNPTVPAVVTVYFAKSQCPSSPRLPAGSSCMSPRSTRGTMMLLVVGDTVTSTAVAIPRGTWS